MGCQMILLSVMIKVLASIREVKARHPASRPLSNQIQIGEILGQFGADSAKDPIQIAITLNSGTLMGEIPNIVAKRLQLHKAQVSTSSIMDFYNTTVQGLAIFVWRGCFMYIS